jgi:hypothetical protein
MVERNSLKTSEVVATLKITFHFNTSGGQYYKNIYRGNLLPFHGDTVILCYKAI